MRGDDPFFAFANVTYDLPERYRGIAMPPGQGGTDSFTISSRELIVPATAIAAAGGRPTEAADRLVDDGSHGWRDWDQVNWGHPPLWRAWTRKVKDPAWRGPEGAALVFDIRCQAANRLLVEFETNGWGAFDAAQPAVSYNAVVPLQAAATARVTSRSPGPGVVRNAVSCPAAPLRRLHRWLVSG